MTSGGMMTSLQYLYNWRLRNLQQEHSSEVLKQPEARSTQSNSTLSAMSAAMLQQTSCDCKMSAHKGRVENSFSLWQEIGRFVAEAGMTHTPILFAPQALSLQPTAGGLQTMLEHSQQPAQPEHSWGTTGAQPA